MAWRAAGKLGISKHQVKLQADLDARLGRYNNQREPQWPWCYGTPHAHPLTAQYPPASDHLRRNRQIDHR
ncbi:hypothetical protein CJO89_22155 (plasmid) [Ralstonia solanacearum]|nr:hypothetical protein CJO89_22155 [Ralstonia solanacearum]